MKMKHLLPVIFVILLSCQTGYALQCYTCDVGLCDTNSTIVTCQSGAVCGKLTSSGYSAKVCAPTSICDTTVSGIRTYCCSTDLCNSAVSAKVSFVTVIAALVALRMTKQ
ncbi:long neurotoxin homolog TA-bm16-like [Pelobates fuscus]|uniref:long neurotoxin homolog TA-bm16-like n=1 Tax=Pelobates fuscus TaxID=191477 RepID=UPI002FE47398